MIRLWRKPSDAFLEICWKRILQSSYHLVSAKTISWKHKWAFKNLSIYTLIINPHTPVAQKNPDELVFRRFEGDGVEFFLIEPHWLPLRFLMRIFWKIPIWTLPAFIFQWVFISRSVFNQSLITSFCINKIPIFCRISDESALIRNFLSNGREWG